MALRSASAVSENEDSYEAGEELARAILAKLELQRRSIGILYATMEFDFEKLLAGLKTHLDIPVIGCTTYSNITEAGYAEESAVLLVLTSDSLEVGCGLGEGLSRDAEAAVAAACEAAQRGLQGPPRLIITFPDVALTPSLSADTVLQSLSRRFPETPIVGGLPADGGQYKRTYQFFGARVCSDAIPVVLLGGDIHPIVATRSGWVPTATKGHVTRSQEGHLCEIDGRPAIEYLKRYIADVDDPDILGSYPLAVYDPELSQLSEKYSKYAVMRFAFRYDKETGVVHYAVPIAEGAEVSLARGSRDDAIAGLDEAARSIVGNTQGRGVSCVMVFSCAARKLLLGLQIDREIEALKTHFSRREEASDAADKVAISGWYTYGEIGPIDSADEHLRKVRFHNATVVLCAL
ncbi:MAG TPA: FIST N-terminal domain-containing protein [Polyangia bacterium]|jgi:hypothetical protein|nr:FIST N-terminal domain-containing protein [Polyangia bacterium]